jgi:arginase
VLRVPFDPEHADAPGLLAFVRRRPVWVHVDIDVVDPSEVPAVVFPVGGGPSLRALSGVLGALASVCEVRGFELCGYDPTKDPEEKLPARLADLAAGFISAASRQSPSKV